MREKLFSKSKMLLICLILLGGFFRFYDLNWDQNQHLHPDERFLTMVGEDMKIPQTFAQYLSPQLSPMNPANIGHSFYVYGTFPVILNKLLAMVTGNDMYNNFTLLGRLLSGCIDLLTIIAVFKTAELFEKKERLNKNVKYWAAFFYAIAVLPIQLSHFFTVDMFFSGFVFFSLYFAIRFSHSKNAFSLLLSSLFLGLSVASKATAIFISPLLLYFFVNAYASQRHIKKGDLIRLVADLLLFSITAYLAVRIADPYLFQTGNFFDLSPNKLFLSNLKELETWSSPQAWFPPSVQWIHKTPILFALKNLILYGTGIVYAAYALLGIYYVVRKLRSTRLTIILIWILLFFLYQSLQQVQTMRYFIILYPFLAILSGIGFVYFAKQVPKLFSGILLLCICFWTFLFFSIYTKPVTRVSATEWIYHNIPSGKVILTESWDDGLPLPTSAMVQKHYISEQLPVFDPDTQQKWAKMNLLLKQGNYLILSSNRGWGSIPTVPERYPQMTSFYHDLFMGKTPYKKTAEFTSYPSLTYLGIPLRIPDDNAEEAFTVYDHPKVMIFKNESN